MYYNKQKSFLCKIGFHSVDKEHIYIRRNKKRIRSRFAFCKRCNKKLYRVDKHGIKKEN